jgi:adenosylcobinamide-GDP ribazoletransferase
MRWCVRWCVHELRLFFTALQFFSRVPVPAWVGYSPEQLTASSKHFTTVGVCVGAVAAGVLLSASMLFSAPVCVVLSMAATVLFTGAFHEDGFADSCDGFGGGFTTERVLAIMKDSRVGSYATVGIALLFFLKMQLLIELTSTLTAPLLIACIVASHALSRFSAVCVMAMLPYVQADAVSKSKPIAKGIGASSLLFSLVVSSVPAAFLSTRGALAVAVSVVTALLAARYFLRDALGATQQLSEVAILMAMVARVTQ